MRLTGPLDHGMHRVTAATFVWRCCRGAKVFSDQGADAILSCEGQPEAQKISPAPHPVWRWAPYSIGIHLALPLLFALIWYLAGEAVTATVLIWMHVVFAGVLVVTLPWWWRLAEAVAMLLVLNHVATFLTGSILVWLLRGPLG